MHVLATERTFSTVQPETGTTFSETKIKANKPLCQDPILYTASFGSTQKSLIIYTGSHSNQEIFYFIYIC